MWLKRVFHNTYHKEVINVNFIFNDLLRIESGKICRIIKNNLLCADLYKIVVRGHKLEALFREHARVRMLLPISSESQFKHAPQATILHVSGQF